MWALVLWVMYLLGVLGLACTSLYAVLEYVEGRLDDLAAAVDELSGEDVWRQYVLPLQVQKLHRWATAGAPARRRYSLAVGDPDAADVAAAVVPLRRALLLEPAEFATYVALCMEEVRRDFRWWPGAYLRRRVEDACAGYVWRDGGVLQDLLVQVADVRVALALRTAPEPV